MKCPNCESTEVYMIVDAMIRAPISFYGNLGKQQIRKKEVELVGVYWPEALITCHSCGFQLHPNRNVDMDALLER